MNIEMSTMLKKLNKKFPLKLRSYKTNISPFYLNKQHSMFLTSNNAFIYSKIKHYFFSNVTIVARFLLSQTK